MGFFFSVPLFNGQHNRQPNRRAVPRGCPCLDGIIRPSEEDLFWLLLYFFFFICVLFCFFLVDVGGIERPSYLACLGAALSHIRLGTVELATEEMLDRKELDPAVIPGEGTMAHLVGRV